MISFVIYIVLQCYVIGRLKEENVFVPEESKTTEIHLYTK